MTQIFFKSNAEGSEIVKIECSSVKIDFDHPDTQAFMDGIAAPFISIPINFHSCNRTTADLERAFFPILGGMCARYARLRRQHKAKGRGKNWRVVR